MDISPSPTSFLRHPRGREGEGEGLAAGRGRETRRGTGREIGRGRVKQTERGKASCGGQLARGREVGREGGRAADREREEG